MSNVFVAGGHVQAQEAYVYLSREADRKILDVCRAGGLAYVLNTRQVGKSSLMIRAAETLLKEGAAVAIVDLTEIGANLTVDQWYRGILVSVAEQLGLPIDAAAWWDDNSQLGPTHRFSRFFRDVALEHCKSKRVVVFIDEIDTTLSLPFRGPATDDFFAALRALHLGRAKDPELKRLSVVLLGVATPSDLIMDPDRTPFNIGERIELGDFTEAEAQSLLQESGIPAQYATSVLKQVLRWTGGHPFLTLRVFRSLKEDPPGGWSPADIEDRVRLLFFGTAEEGDSNLRFVRDMLLVRSQDKGKGLETYLSVIKGKRVQDQDNRPDIEWLKLSGIVRTSDGVLECRNRIYAETFTAQWAQDQQPGTYWQKTGKKQTVVMLQTALAVFVLLGLGYGYLSVQSANVNLSAARQELSRLEQARSAAVIEQKRTSEIAEKQQAEANGKLKKLQELQDHVARQATEAASKYSDALAKYLAAKALESSALAVPLLLESVIRKPTVSGISALMEQIVQQRHIRATLTHQGSVRAVTFSPDGKTVATASADNTARLWDAASGQPRATLLHQAEVYAVTFSSDGKTVATASLDSTARLWDAASGQPRATLTYQGTVAAVTFSPSRPWLVVAAWNEAQFYPFEPKAIIAAGCDYLPANLTKAQWDLYLPDEPYRKTCPNLKD